MVLESPQGRGQAHPVPLGIGLLDLHVISGSGERDPHGILLVAADKTDPGSALWRFLQEHLQPYHQIRAGHV